MLSAAGVTSDFVLWDNQGVRLENWLTLFIGAVSALLIEFVSHEGLLDDNLTIPVGASLIMIGTHALFAGHNLASYFNPVQYLIRRSAKRFGVSLDAAPPGLRDRFRRYR